MASFNVSILFKTPPNFGGLRRSKFGESHLYGPDAARFYTKLKTMSQKWPEQIEGHQEISLAFKIT